MADISTLKDNFNDNSIDTGIWNEFEWTGDISVDEVNQRLQITLPVSVAGEIQGGVITWVGYNAVGGSVHVEVVEVPNPASGDHHATFTLTELDVEGDFHVMHEYYVYKSGTNLIFQSYDEIDGTVEIYSTTYNATDHRWWRMREASGTIYFDTSPDGTNWTNRASGTAIFTPDYAFVAIKGVSLASHASPGKASFDNLNLVPIDKTFTVDGIVKEIKTDTITADGIVKETKTHTFTSDAIVRETETFTFTADGVVKVETIKTFTADAVVKEIKSATFTTDGVIREEGTRIFSVDGIVKEINTKTFTIDGIIFATNLKEFTVDGIVEAVGTYQLTADGIIRLFYYRLGEAIIPRPDRLVRGFVSLKTDIHTLTGKVGRDISYTKESYQLSWDNLTKSDADRILSIINLNQAVNFEVNAGLLRISPVSVIPNVVSKQYTMLGDDYRVTLVLELIEEII